MPPINLAMWIAVWCWRKMSSWIQTIWKPALFFVFFLIIALLINTPVGHLMARVKIPDGVKISPLQGTIFKGQADTVVVNQLIIQDLEYRFKISCLITASLCYQINFTDGSALIRYSPIEGSIKVSQLDTELSMSNLSSLSNQLLIQPTGSLNLNANRLIFIKGRLVDIDATVIWENAGIVGDDINLGDYQLTIKRDTEQYQMNLIDKDALLDVAGEGELKSDGIYSLDININAKSGLEARIKSALEFVASKKGLRQYNIHRTGTLDKRLLSYLSFESP